MNGAIFECKKCGQCCTGQGGIVVSPHDLLRLCATLKVDGQQFIEKFGLIRNNKLHVRTYDGKCIFFQSGQGCVVHAAKPDICRAWPFFKGNLIDVYSFAMAKEFCPGINTEIDHADFVTAGLHYLHDNNLVADDPLNEANALMVNE